MRILAVLLVSTLITACSVGNGNNVTAASEDPSAFLGTWAQRAPAAGTSFVLTVSAQSGSVAVAGTYTLDDGTSGPVTGTGTVSGGVLQLSLTYAKDQAQINAALDGATALTGTLHFGPPQALTPSAVVAFDKKS